MSFKGFKYKFSAEYSVRKAASAAGIVAFCLSGPVHAESLTELIPSLLKSHNLVKASEADLDAATNRVRETLGGWFPTLNVTAHYGRELQNKPEGTDDTEFVTREADFSVKQLVWDFGATNARVRATEFTRDSVKHTLESIKQDLILRAVTAFMNVKRTADVLALARKSEANIKKQTELEDALVKRGAGLSSDVLQAKATLSGAQARRVQAQGALAVARNAYRAVFHTDTADINGMKKPELPEDLIPPSLKDAIELALNENPKLLTADAGARVAKETIKATKSSSFYPTIEAVAEAKLKEDAGGTAGNQQEQVAKIQMSFPFNLGFTAINTLKAAEGDATSAAKRLGESKDLTEQQVRDSWDNLKTAKNTADFLRNQADIQSEFLALARKERQLGNRSLIDVLSGETAFINATSDATSAETDVAIAVFTLLNNMGRLNLDAIRD